MKRQITVDLFIFYSNAIGTSVNEEMAVGRDDKFV